MSINRIYEEIVITNLILFDHLQFLFFKISFKCCNFSILKLKRLVIEIILLEKRINTSGLVLDSYFY